tara:strand:+ start:756 stop:1532 length:777 start_codon:yes stop_codon:yes gene_type:complete
MGNRAYTSLSGQAYPDQFPDWVIDNFSTMNLSDGSWTYSDPLSMISTYSYNASTGYNEIRLNSVTNDALQPTANPSQCPRWYKLATYDDGSPVLGSDNFILTITTILKGSTVGTLRYIQHMLGVAEDISQNSDPLAVNKWSGLGQLWGFSNADSNSTGAIIQGSTVTGVSSSLTDTKSFGTVSVFGRSAENTIVGLNAAGENEGSNANSFSGGLYSASGQLYIIYIFGQYTAGKAYSTGTGTDVSYLYKFTKIINAGI